LGSTSVVTDSSGAQYGYTRYYPYGSTRDSGGSLDTSKKFTGQRLDGTGLYYYGARYYDPVIGRFISPDTLVPNPANPQAFNRYSYVLNNPLKYTDPTGHGWWSIITDIASIVFDVYQLVKHPSWGNAGWLTLDVGLTLLPGVPAGAGPAAKALRKGDKIIEGADKIVEGVKAEKTGAHVAEEIVTRGKTVIGRYPKNMDLAEKVGGNYLNIPMDEWKAMSGPEKWAKNQKWLDEAIARGDEIIAATPKSSIEAGTYYDKEINYLTKEKGYTWNNEGTELIAPK